MRRQGYVTNAKVMSVGFTFDANDVSSSLECATLSVQQGNSTISFLYDKVALVCRGISDVLESSDGTVMDIEYYKLTCRETGKPTDEASDGYLGCFQDDIPRDLSGPQVPFPSDNTPEKCRMLCQMSDYLYAAVQFGKECFCGNSYGGYGSLPETECNSPCPGNASLMCGGEWKNSVYTTETN